MKKLKFFDLRERKVFETDDYEIKLVKGKRIAYAMSPDGNRVVKIVGKNF